MPVSVKKSRCLGIPISPSSTLASLLTATEEALRSGSPLLITFVNPWICSKWKAGRTEYQRLFDKFDYVCCDGVGMVVAAKLTISGATLDRVSFDETSFAGPFFKACVANGCEVMLVGGAAGVSKSAAHAISTKVPGLVFAAAFDGFEEVDLALRYLAEHPSTPVVCGMGLPYQEQFLIRAAALGWRGVGATCGGFLDQVNVSGAYYPTWVNAFNLRWLYRLLKEPKRLWRRYLIEYWPFAVELVIALGRRLTKKDKVPA